MRIYKPQTRVTTSEIHPGTLLISQGFWNNEEFHRSIVLILEHGEEGSTGIILNKMSNMTVDMALPGFNVDQPLYYGGPVNTNKIGFIHQCKNISRALKITNELYWGGNIYQLKRLIEKGELDPAAVKYYAGFVDWMPGELIREINDKSWWIDEFSFDELIENKAVDLWSLKLIQQENLYGMLYRVPDPILN
jgi:putative transcriptional regulator